MNAEDLMELKPSLDEYLKCFSDCFVSRASEDHLGTCVSGQLSNLDRKSLEPIALAAGVAPRTLQDFFSRSLWDEDKASRHIREIVQREYGLAGAIGIIDESGFPKKGTKTPGVGRQHCGQTGKIDNCVVTVNLGFAAGDFHCLVDSDIYVPKSWFEDEARRKEAKIPGELVFRTKLEIAVDLIKRTLADGLQLTWLLADELYGRSAEFRAAVASLGLHYVVEVPCSTQGWTRKKDVKNSKAVSVEDIWSGRAACDLFRIKDTENGPEVWEGHILRFFPREDNCPGKKQWLVSVQNVLTNEKKYFLSNAPRKIHEETLLRIAFSRWHIERIFQDGKGEVGMGHFEIRNYLSLKRHLIITMISFLFLARSTDRLNREKKIYHIVPD